LDSRSHPYPLDIALHLFVGLHHNRWGQVQRARLVRVNHAALHLAVASKAKRSKIRAFALIFEELGDLLIYPEALKERDGLRLANALRNGSEADLRDVLSRGTFENAEHEWDALEAVIEAQETKSRKDPARGGRPTGFAAKPTWQGDTRVLSSGVTLRHARDSNGHMIRIGGKALDKDLIESAIEHLAYLLEKPDD
jgi:ParB family chromosome partitioning protein